MATNAEMGKKMAQNFPKASLALADIHTEARYSPGRRGILGEGHTRDKVHYQRGRLVYILAFPCKPSTTSYEYGTSAFPLSSLTGVFLWVAQISTSDDDERERCQSLAKKRTSGPSFSIVIRCRCRCRHRVATCDIRVQQEPLPSGHEAAKFRTGHADQPVAHDSSRKSLHERKRSLRRGNSHCGPGVRDHSALYGEEDNQEGPVETK